MTNWPEQGSGSRSESSLQEVELRPRSLATLVTLVVCAALAFAGFVALGTWQLQRLQWKRALIARVEQRVHAVPLPAPGPERWPQVSAEADEYRHVRLTGTFLYEFTTKVQASTGLGSGYWLLTPLRSAEGYVVLVNRGFIPASAVDRIDDEFHDEMHDARHQKNRAGRDEVVVTGLLRISEPGGGFLRHNDPAGNRWYSRDIQAIAAARGLAQVAPYFVDADAAEDPADKQTGSGNLDHPVGGLTVISFRNDHLVYAITWYALALMVLGAGLWLMREERRLRRTDCVDRETGNGGEN